MPRTTDIPAAVSRSSAVGRWSRIVLASASPRRAELLRQIGVSFEVKPAEIDETPRDGENPADYVRRMALEKARAGWAAGATMPVLGADTTVVVDGEVLGKPRDRSEALAMHARLSGRGHEVLSAVALVAGPLEDVVLSRSQVNMRRISPAESEAYWHSGEPRDKAGAYAIQGFGAVFVARLQGSYSGVMGLPLYETAWLLREFGLDVMPISERME